LREGRKVATGADDERAKCKDEFGAAWGSERSLEGFEVATSASGAAEGMLGTLEGLGAELLVAGNMRNKVLLIGRLVFTPKGGGRILIVSSEGVAALGGDADGEVTSEGVKDVTGVVSILLICWS
jgi:hypothetical protein